MLPKSAAVRPVSRRIVGASTASTWRSTNDSHEQRAMPMQGTQIRQPRAASDAALRGTAVALVETAIVVDSVRGSGLSRDEPNASRAEAIRGNNGGSSFRDRDNRLSSGETMPGC